MAQFLTGYGYRAAHLSKGRWYATADPAGVKGRNIFWFNPGVAPHRDQAARLPVEGRYQSREKRLSKSSFFNSH